MTRRTRTFDDVSDSRCAPQIANDHGLQPEVDLQGPTHKRAGADQPERPGLPARPCARRRRRGLGGGHDAEGRAARPRAATRELAAGPARAARVQRLRRPRAPAHQRDVCSGWDVAAKEARRSMRPTASRDRSRAERRQQRRRHPAAARSGARKTPLAHACRSTAAQARALAEALFRAIGAALRRRPRRGRADARLRVGSQRRRSAASARCSRASTTVVEVSHRFDAAHGPAHRVRASNAVAREALSDARWPTHRRSNRCSDARVPQGWGGRWYGVYPALVVDIKDPDGQGRVKVDAALVARQRRRGATRPGRGSPRFMGGNNRGSWFIPDVDDEVLVAFEARRRAPALCDRRRCGTAATSRPSRWTAAARTTRRCCARATA